jgi:hypothetical protein
MNGKIWKDGNFLWVKNDLNGNMGRREILVYAVKRLRVFCQDSY